MDEYKPLIGDQNGERVSIDSEIQSRWALRDQNDKLKKILGDIGQIAKNNDWQGDFEEIGKLLFPLQYKGLVRWPE